ncbi:MAG: hypothetical protein Q8R07_04400 [Candidatus Uhrbacteria bacterium]|nr:hypothetical protein [Candidatus Uhrbacteria bacterium]
MSLLLDGNLLPFRQYSESDVLNIFSSDVTGLNGMLVSITNNSNQDPPTSAGAYSTSAPNGYAFTNVGNYAYRNSRKVRAAGVADNRSNVLGVTLHTTATVDENGNLLVNQPYDKTIERGFVQTGFTVPILTRGVITVKLSNIGGTPTPGWAATIGTGGQFAVGDPAEMVVIGTGTRIVGKYLSTSGSAFGGYAQIKLEL